MILRTERAAEPEADVAVRAWLEPRASKMTPYPDRKGRAAGKIWRRRELDNKSRS
jgi:hypothetical protein